MDVTTSFCVVVDHKRDMSIDEPRYILTGKDSAGSVFLLKDILASYVTIALVALTKNPSHLITAEDVDLMSAPCSITL